MRDEQFQRVGRVVLSHLLLFFPLGRGVCLEAHMLIVERRSGVLDPEVAHGDPRIREVRISRNLRRIAPGPANFKHPRRCPPVSLPLGDRTFWNGMQSEPPDQTLPAQTTLPVFPNRLPITPGFLKKSERHRRGIPSLCNPEDALPGIPGQFEPWQEAGRQEEKCRCKYVFDHPVFDSRIFRVIWEILSFIVPAGSPIMPGGASSR